MVPAGNKAKCLSLVNHTTKTIIIIKRAFAYNKFFLKIRYFERGLSTELNNPVPYNNEQDYENQRGLKLVSSYYSGYTISSEKSLYK